MYPIFDPQHVNEYLQSYRSRDFVPFTCPECLQTFRRTKHDVHLAVWKGVKNIFCSNNCNGKFTTERIGNEMSKNIPCGQCGQIVSKPPSVLKSSKSGNVFCSRSCAVSYNNVHKTHGNRRSKLEVFLENEIRTKWPTLIMECNAKTAIESELDFYFPELRFAIELNGILHYEPIYGADKLEQIRNNDVQKMQQCLLMGIELCVVDVSKCKYLSPQAKAQYRTLVLDLLTSIMGRLK